MNYCILKYSDEKIKEAIFRIFIEQVHQAIQSNLKCFSAVDQVHQSIQSDRGRFSLVRTEESKKILAIKGQARFKHLKKSENKNKRSSSWNEKEHDSKIQKL